MSSNAVSEIPFTDITGGLFIGITTSGDCIVRGVGEMNSEDVAAVTGKLVLLVSRLRNAARQDCLSTMLH